MPSPIAHGDAILIADPSMTGGAVAAALRARSFAVIEVPLSLLATRALAESPRAIVIDVDQPGAIDAVERARDLLPSAPPDVFCLGDPLRAAELGATRAAGRAFGRPVDVAAVVAAVVGVATPIPQSELIPSSLAQRRPTIPPRSDSEPPPVSELPSVASDALELMPPSLSDPANRLFLNDVSPELERILNAAEQRVGTHRRPSSVPSLLSPDEELDMLVPSDLLAALDEPLDPEEDASGTGSGAGVTSAPRQPTGTSANRTGIDTTSSEGTVARALANEPLGEGKTPVSVITPANMDLRLELRPPAFPALDLPPPRPAEDAGRAAIPPPSREPPSTLPPSSGPRAPAATFEVRPSAREWSAPEIPSSPLRAPMSPPFPKTPAVPVIRDSGMLGRPAAPLSPPSFEGALIRTGASPILPLPSVPEVTFADRTLAGLTPVSGIDAVRGQPPPEAAAVTRQSPSSLPPPAVLGEGDALLALARAVATRASGSLALGAEPTMRRIVLHDGDIVTAASAAPEEALLAFLTARGDLPREVAARLAGKLPAFGRHAGAALIAHGHLGQDDLWPVLRAHAEWVIGRAINIDAGTWEIEPEPPGRLKAEPNVFGGATGAEVLVEQVRRAIPPDVALRRVGGASARLAEGSRRSLLAECALRREEEALVRSAPGLRIGDLLKGAEPELANVLYALVSLGVLDALASPAPDEAEAESGLDPLDAEALRQRVRARVALVEDGDYFAVLGVGRAATGYEIRRAYLDLRRSFEPSRMLTAATADLFEDVRLIVEVLDEAYDILRDPHRRERYRRAIESGPP